MKRSWLLDLLSDSGLTGLCLQVLPHRGNVEQTRDPEGPWERSAPFGEVDADQVAVHGGSTAGQTTGGIDDEDTVDHDDTQQGGLRIAFPATHAGAHRGPDAGRR